MAKTTMIDKTLYRQAYEQYKQWNDIKFAERIRNTANLSSAERWEQYVDLVELLWEMSPDFIQTPRQRQQKIAEWEYYYSQMQRFEERRRKHGFAKTT